ncbi:hypothetical protein K7X08_034006 [Anisodus acutangulus]|uniref:Uncharacterized protein n=1 Tax=Anisodus acutangulus TaxID=402998 RepID=A0A9Q1LPU9_9SOLA|nr:hypothetical protein K7X08_034006 [Anisodus acutangulus]
MPVIDAAAISLIMSTRGVVDLATYSFLRDTKGYERNNYGAVTIQAYTTISPRNLMHEDICTLALDVLASVEVEDHILRTLNSSVLDRVPCSVGILIDRGQLRRSNSVHSSENVYYVAILFLGEN